MLQIAMSRINKKCLTYHIKTSPDAKMVWFFCLSCAYNFSKPHTYYQDHYVYGFVANELKCMVNTHA